MSSKAYKFVSQLSLKDGYSYRGNCPSCGSKNVFTATNQGGLVVYNCYKLGCDASGVYSAGLTAEEIKRRIEQLYVPKNEPEAWPLPVTISFDTSGPAMHKFITAWGLQHVQLLYDIVQHRAVFPIVTERGKLIDANGRTLRGDVPKWYRYTGEADYYHCGKGPVAVVVEDCISAAVVGSITGLTGVAILGTSLGPAHMDYLQRFSHVVVALDPDAMHKTLQYAKMLKSRSISATALRLTDDLKYRCSGDMEALRIIATTYS